MIVHFSTFENKSFLHPLRVHGPYKVKHMKSMWCRNMRCVRACVCGRKGEDTHCGGTERFEFRHMFNAASNRFGAVCSIVKMERCVRVHFEHTLVEYSSGDKPPSSSLRHPSTLRSVIFTIILRSIGNCFAYQHWACARVCGRVRARPACVCFKLNSFTKTIKANECSMRSSFF